MKGDIVFNVPVTMFVKDHGFYQMMDFVKLKQEDEKRRQKLQEEGKNVNAESAFVVPYLKKNTLDNLTFGPNNLKWDLNHFK